MSKMFPRWFGWMLFFFALFGIIALVVIYVLAKKQAG